MIILHVVIPGEAVAQGRPRMSKNGHAYTPAKSRAYRELAKLAIAKEWGDRPPLETPLCISVVVVVQAPKKLGKKVLKDMEDNGTLVPCGVKPDWDNFGKMSSDSCEGIVVKNDSQFWSGTVQKFYGAMPRMEITVSES